MLRKDVAWALAAFLIIMLTILVLSYIGWDRWSVEP